MKIQETDFYKERTTFRKRNLKVFYGIDIIMKSEKCPRSAIRKVEKIKY